MQSEIGLKEIRKTLFKKQSSPNFWALESKINKILQQIIPMTHVVFQTKFCNVTFYYKMKDLR